MQLHFHSLLLSIASLLVAASLAPTAIQADNTYPIVLVHGFSGWGRDELLGFKYWGGLQGDFQEELEALGYTVYTAVVGPFSSNWDRACELYAQIKGGQVDYGQSHSASYDHLRYGRNFTGLYPEWGETNADGSINKVHLIGHSMGGQTIRMLTQLLEQGTSGAPVEEDSSSHPLFEGGHSWVHSITTVSTPNQGTLLADGIATFGDTAFDALATAFALIGIAGDDSTLIYDAKLDQWGVSAKSEDETLSEYLTRVFSSSVFIEGFKDVCLWSLSTSGAAEENTWVTTLSDVYYYSYATMDSYPTYDWLLRKISLPNFLTMLLPLDVFAVFLGSRYGPNHGFSTDWQPNDGLVDTISMISDSTGKVVSYSGSSQIGQWNQMTQLSNMDHVSVMGITLLTQVLELYSAHAKLLLSLPVSSSRRQLTDGATDAVSAAITSLNVAASSVKTPGNLKKRGRFDSLLTGVEPTLSKSPRSNQRCPRCWPGDGACAASSALAVTPPLPEDDAPSSPEGGTSSDLKAAEAKTLVDLALDVSNWALHSDHELHAFLKRYSADLFGRTKELEDNVPDIAADADSAHVRLKNTFNQFLMLSNNQFIENHVYDEEQEDFFAAEAKDGGAKAAAEFIVSKYRAALDLGLEAMKLFVVMVEEDDTSSQFDTVLDIYNERPLPFIIGTREFLEDETLGLGAAPEEFSDSDSDSSYASSYSSSDSASDSSSQREKRHSSRSRYRSSSEESSITAKKTRRFR
ncbi:hypothetical protein PRNP1_004621 [Phytophthora ramorum]